MYSTAFLDLPPLQAAAGEVHLPGSKSISNRVLLLAALAEGDTLVEALLDSDENNLAAIVKRIGADPAQLAKRDETLLLCSAPLPRAASAPTQGPPIIDPSSSTHLP